MVNYYWKVQTVEQEKAAKLKEELGLTSNIISKIFVQRGLEKFKQVKEFIHPQLSNLHDPFLMKDMDKAVKIILAAINQKEKILLYGDYDVDGTSSIALSYRYLSKIYDQKEFDYYLPDRYAEGYGISKAGIDYAIQNGFRLIISLDCGINSVGLIKYASDNHISTIVCDHHIPGDILPPAKAILNPKQPGCHYPFKELCGCGVAFKLFCALNTYLNLPEENYLQLLDLAALATGADIVPLTGENRIITWHGLKKLNTNPCTGLHALKKVCGSDQKFNNEKTVFYLAPRINAAGRMAHGNLAVKLLIEDNMDKADELARQLQELNNQRKTLLQKATEEAIACVEKDSTYSQKKTTVLFHKDWHQGILGIIASKMVENYYRPAVILTDGSESIKGSARSVNGYNIYEALKQCENSLEKFGGHASAAGVSLAESHLNRFADEFDKVVSNTISPEDMIPKIYIDSEISLDEINFKLYRTICRMEPFGPENTKPIFLTKRITLDIPPRVLNEKHVRFTFRQYDSTSLNGIAFNMAEKLPSIRTENPIDFVFSIEENIWNNSSNLQINIIDFRNSK